MLSFSSIRLAVHKGQTDRHTFVYTYRLLLLLDTYCKGNTQTPIVWDIPRNNKILVYLEVLNKLAV